MGSRLVGVGPSEGAEILAVFAFGLLLAIASDAAALSAAARRRGGRTGAVGWAVALASELFSQALAASSVFVCASLWPNASDARLLATALFPVALARLAAGARLCRSGPATLAFALGFTLPWQGALSIRLQAGALLALAGLFFLGLLMLGQLSAGRAPARRLRVIPK